MWNKMEFPAQYAVITQTECVELFGGATATSETGIVGFMSTISKIGKVFSYISRLFSAASSILNGFSTIYTTFTGMMSYIQTNF